MSNQIAALSRMAAAALMAAAVLWPIEAARAHGSASWQDDDGPRHRLHRHHERHERDDRHAAGRRHSRPIVLLPRPHVIYVTPPHIVYMASPHRHHQRRVAAHPVSLVYVTRGGQYCRDYRESIVIAGVVRIGSCTACLQRDGVWRIVGGSSGRPGGGRPATRPCPSC